MARSQQQYRVSALAGLKYLFRWIRNPVSFEGSSNVAKIKMAVGAPEFQARVEEMQADATGRRILNDRPDLGMALADKSLAQLPQDTLGYRFYDHTNFEGAVPGYLLAGLIYRGPEYDQLDWSEDMKYLLHRFNNVHDLIHQLCGYGTDLAGEALTIAYSIGLESMEVRKARRVGKLWAHISWVMMGPSVGFRKYREYCYEALERGIATAARRPLHNIYFEELLSMPLDQVRRELGVPPKAEPFDTLDWKLSWLGERIATGYKPADDAAKSRMAWVDNLVAAGIPVKTLVNLRQKTFERMLERAEAGAGADELRTMAGMG